MPLSSDRSFNLLNKVSRLPRTLDNNQFNSDMQATTLQNNSQQFQQKVVMVHPKIEENRESLDSSYESEDEDQNIHRTRTIRSPDYRERNERRRNQKTSDNHKTSWMEQLKEEIQGETIPLESQDEIIPDRASRKTYGVNRMKQ